MIATYFLEAIRRCQIVALEAQMMVIISTPADHFGGLEQKQAAIEEIVDKIDRLEKQ